MAGDEPGDKRPLLVVARGQRSLLEAVRELFAELGGVDVIEDQGPSLLSCEDRNDKPQRAGGGPTPNSCSPAGAPSGELARH
jgi:hypothetical protein